MTKNKTIVMNLLLASLLAIFAMQNTFAKSELTKNNSLTTMEDLKTPLESVLLDLYMEGYYGINAIKYKKDFYEVTGINNEGKTVKTTLSAKEGPIYKLPANLPFSTIKPKSQLSLTMLQAVINTIGDGNHGFFDVREVETVSIKTPLKPYNTTGDFYHITACNKAGKKIENYLATDGKSGFGETGFNATKNCE